MKLDKLNGQQLYAAISIGVENLVAHQKTLDEINVFPVPDGDTGTNMVKLENHITKPMNLEVVADMVENIKVLCQQ